MVKKQRVILFSVLALMLMFALAPAQAFAATKKVKTYSNSATTQPSKLPRVYKGTTKLSVKSNGGTARRWGAVRFVAPKTKTYSFTVTGLKNNNFKKMLGVSHLRRWRNNAWEYSTVKTNGGSTNVFRFANKFMANTTNIKKEDLVNRFLYKRTFKAKLKKGEAACITFEVAGTNGTKMLYPNYSLKLTIK